MNEINAIALNALNMTLTKLYMFMMLKEANRLGLLSDEMWKESLAKVVGPEVSKSENSHETGSEKD